MRYIFSESISIKLEKPYLEEKETNEAWGNFFGLAHVCLEAENCERVWVLSYPDDEERRDELSFSSGKWVGTFPYGSFNRYRFRLLINNRLYWLNQAGIFPYPPTEDTDFKVLQEKPPNWVYESVFYQIFPDRFRRSKNGRYQTDWNNLPKDWYEHFGGDLFGIKESISYLKELGINALYLNPIFRSSSNHKYDTEEFEIDPHFGDEKEFLELINCLHTQNMRILLDGVFNHVGINHKWVKEKPEFFTKNKRNKLVSWCGFDSLPKLDYSNTELQTLICEIACTWLKKGVDGWRLDAIHMLGCHGTSEKNHEILSHLRKEIKKTKQDAFILGEHFFESTRFIGNQEDSAMNYFGFTRPVWAFLAGQDFSGLPFKLNAAEFAAVLKQARDKLPWENALAQFNLLNSHDTPRFLTVSNDKHLTKLAVTMLFTYIGVPCVYYGDEIGLHGNQDPDNRRPMIWDKNLWDLEIFETYQQLIYLRKKHISLQKGDFELIKADDDTFSFSRSLDNEEVIVEVDRKNGSKIQINNDIYIFN